jgi:hypothetical protein
MRGTNLLSARKCANWPGARGAAGRGREYLLTRGQSAGIVPTAAVLPVPKSSIRGAFRCLVRREVWKRNLSCAGYTSLPCMDAEPTPGHGPL